MSRGRGLLRRWAAELQFNEYGDGDGGAVAWVVGEGAVVQRPLVMRVGGGDAAQQPWCCTTSAELQCNTPVSD